MIQLVSWLVFGLVVGAIAKWFYPVEGEHGAGVTIGIGVVGSFVGGLASYLLAGGASVYQPAGFAFAILGAVATIAAWKWYSSQP